jgi:hypothetical protein
MKASVAARLAAAKAKQQPKQLTDPAATAFPKVASSATTKTNSKKRFATASPTEASASSTKRAHFELDLSVTAPTFGKTTQGIVVTKEKKVLNPYLAHHGDGVNKEQAATKTVPKEKNKKKKASVKENDNKPDAKKAIEEQDDAFDKRLPKLKNNSLASRKHSTSGAPKPGY